MRSSKPGLKTSNVASNVWHVSPSCWKQMLPISSSSIFVNKNSFKMASPCSFSKKNTPIMPLDQYPHQTVLGASMYACGFFLPQMRQFYLFTYPPKSKWASSEKTILFWPKSASSVSQSRAHLAQRCSSVYTTIFLRRKDKTNYLANQRRAKCYHSRNKH